MARMHLGSLGTVREAVDADFDYFGEVIRVHPDASDLQQAELMILAEGIDVSDIDMDDPESWTPGQRVVIQKANDAVAQAIRGQVHPDDWDRFFKTARANRQFVMDLMALSKQISEMVAGFPTGQQSVSSPTPPVTDRKSRRGSLRRADATARSAMRQLEGRPDLQMAVVAAHKAKVEEIAAAG